MVSHVGFLDHGRFQLVEETDSLLARFRQIIVRLPVGNTVPDELPNHWIQQEIEGTTLRFIDSNWIRETSGAAITRFFGAAPVDIRSLSLREIVVALAKAGRKIEPARDSETRREL